MEKKVLFIDDDKDWREVVAEGLNLAGYEVVTAADASLAMEAAGRAEPGLIILDLNLAGENGSILMQFLRANHPGVPILLFTGMQHDDAAVRALLEQGADQYLQKGSIEELIVTVGSYFRS
ncbi:MAG TPA: response regulator [Candidatus Binatia bacterium]|nr:response regulator [Candidatus Binatia bacterium]